MRVLVVDDQPDICGLVKVLGSRHGFEVDCAFNGEEAIAHFDAARLLKQPYRVILLDLALPLKNGFTVLKEIRSMERLYPELGRARVITFSAYTDEINDSTLFQVTEGDYHIEKPDKDGELQKIILERLNYLKKANLIDYE